MKMILEMFSNVFIRVPVQCIQVLLIMSRARGGGGYSTNFFTGRLCPEV